MTKILLVEDDKSLREIYGVRLLAEGYDIVSAGDGEEALAMAIKERPQLIISDVMMPKISGFDMLDILRSTTETKGIKVIMMTALSSEDQRERGESLGADRYLVKSQVGIEDVVRTVHEVLGDAPVPGAAGNVFATTPQPQTPRQPAPGVPPRPAATPPAPTAPAVASPAPQPQAVPAPRPQAPQYPPSDQAAPQAPSFMQAASLQDNSNLPQPTAPFSTNRPAGLGDRIIHPIEQPAEAKRDFNNLIAQELNEAPQPATAAPTPPTPPVPPMPKPDLKFEETPIDRQNTPGAQPNQQ